MIRFDRRLLFNFDWVFFLISLVLVFIGILVIFSLSHSQSAGLLSNLYSRQIYWFVISIFALFMILCIDYRNLVRYSYSFYIITILCLVAVLLFGRTAHGAQRWIALGPLTFQPSEFLKIALILTLTRYFDERKMVKWNISNLLFPLILVGIPFLLIVKQPDLGSAMILIPVSLIIFYLNGVRVREILYLVGAGLATTPIFWFLLKSYQKARLLVFLDPERDPLGSAYNIMQSKIAIGSGMFWGKGLFGGTQSRLYFLPERFTDFIFSAFAEEWGFFGVLILLGLYFFLIIRALEIADHARDSIGSIIAAGLVSLLAIQIFINIGMVSGILPIVGISLPLMSYGGSSLLSTFISIGIILNIGMRRCIY